MTHRTLMLIIVPLITISFTSSADACFRRCNRGNGCGTSCCVSVPACGNGCGATAGCSYQEVERTIMVPTMTTETRIVNVTKYRTENRTKTYTVYNCVPETTSVPYEYTVMVPETRTKTIHWTERKPVWNDKEVQYTVSVPHTESKTVTWTEKKPVWSDKEVNYTVLVPHTESKTVTWTERKPVYGTKEVSYTVQVPVTEARVGTRNVCRMTTVKEMRTITEDQGHWETVAAEAAVSPNAGCTTGCATAPSNCCKPNPCCRSACGNGCTSAAGGCSAAAAGCTGLRKVWVANVVTKQIEVTCRKPVVEAVQYNYNVTVCHPETRTKTVQTCSFVDQPMSREVQYTVCKPELRTKTVKVCSYVDEEKSREVQYTVCRPETRTKTVKECSYVEQPMSKECSYTVCVPTKKTGTRQVTTYKQVPEEKTCTYQVCVPFTEQQQVSVQVCHMVPKTVMVKVPVPVGCNTGCTAPAAGCTTPATH